MRRLCYDVGPTTPPRPSSCPPDKPYCDPNRNMCSAVPPTVPCDDGLVGGSFTCTQPNGIFPHPTNCSQYYDCANGNAFLGECNAKQVWSGIGMMCKPKKLSTDCGTFNCNRYPGQLRAYSINNAYYAWCGEILNGEQEIIVLKCERPNEYFTGQMCEFQCKDVKLYADPLDAAWYYDCYRSGTTFVYEHRQCTLNRLFDEPSQSCI
uniref:Uncharacterized protein n=1 Tax=Phlebotomus papatasi TaxID=29031 RepID=A0A1B0D4B3_PHLPP